MSDSSLSSGQITFLLFPSFFSTMIKATSPTVIHCTSSSSSSLLSHTENSLRARQSTLSHKSHSHTLFETHITVNYHQQSLPLTRKSNNQTTNLNTTPAGSNPHKHIPWSKHSNTHNQFTSLALLQKFPDKGKGRRERKGSLKEILGFGRSLKA